jgi:hypothetical protein
MAKESDIIDALNKRGAFIQKFCVERFRDLGWSINEEFPVLVEYSTKQGNVTYESTGDIKATLTNQSVDYSLTAVVECKQRFDCSWSFLTSSVKRGSPKLLDVQFTYESDQSRRCAQGQSIFYYADLRNKEMSNCPLCNYGIEHPPASQREPKEDKRFDSIYASCREVALAMKSSAEEERGQMEFYGPNAGCSTHNVYIPIVMTSAQVGICSYDLKDLSTSKVVKNASVKEVSWLTYAFPLPSYLRIQYDSPGIPMAMKKQPIFIVNFQKCTEFLESLKTYFEKFNKEILHNTEINL